jgi:hypothetical protein
MYMHTLKVCNFEVVALQACLAGTHKIAPRVSCYIVFNFQCIFVYTADKGDLYISVDMYRDQGA